MRERNDETRFAVACAARVALAVRAQGQAPAGRGLTEVQGIKVGHHTLTERPTGCTVILVDGDGAVGGVSQRGGAPGTRETDLLDPLNMVDKVNAVVLSGGSAFGLDAAQGVVRYLEERNIGWQVGAPAWCRSCRPRSCSTWGSAAIRRFVRPPTAATRPRRRPPTGRWPKATSAPAPARRSARWAADGSMKGGVGSAAIALPERTGRRRDRRGQRRRRHHRPGHRAGSSPACALPTARRWPTCARCCDPARWNAQAPPRPGENTTIGLVATNARLTKSDVNRVALMADDGFARAIDPSHTTGDGDTVFALATGRWDGRSERHGRSARWRPKRWPKAIVRAASQAESSAGVPSARELGTVPARLK